jgi:hypothetical protein
MPFCTHDAPVNTSTIKQIQDEEAGYVLVRKNTTKDFTFQLLSDPPGTRRTYSWDDKKSDGIPVELYLYGTRTMHVWINKDEVAFNPQLLKEIQGNIQNALDNIFGWNCRSVIDIKNSIESFLKIADGKIFTTYKEATFDFISPWSFIFKSNLPSAEHYYLSFSNPTLGNRLDKIYGTHGFNYKFCSDLDGNVLILLPDETMSTNNYHLPKMNHMTNIEIFLYRLAEKSLTDYYNNESPMKLQIQADGIIQKSEDRYGYGLNLPDSFLAECFGRDTVKNSKTIFEITTSSFDQIPLNKWPNKPERNKKMSEKEMTTYHHEMYNWITENCKHNHQEETKILYKKFLELYHDSLPEHINYPLYPEDNTEDKKESNSFNNSADLLTEKPAMTTLSMFA